MLHHYLDDFIGGSSTFVKSHEQARRFEDLLSVLGWRNNVKKAEGPAQRVKILGVLVDTKNMQALVTPERLVEIDVLIDSFSTRDSCTVKEIKSLLGKLFFVSKCVVASRAFTRRMVHLIRGSHRGSVRVALGSAFHADLRWWRTFLHEFNGVSLLSLSSLALAESVHFHIFTDASDAAAGASFGSHWFVYEWTPAESARSTCWKEIRALVLAVSTFGGSLSGKRVALWCDNQPMVDAVSSMRSSSDLVMSQVREFYLLCALHRCLIRVKHIKGEDNRAADFLSRLNLKAFLKAVPSADGSPTPVRLPKQHSF